ncbi:LptF/LptG family permease [bacterium]|nr:LptF/LptG family permease [bacterium]NBX82017.1 LptF/LptG family permease [bacterium]
MDTLDRYLIKELVIYFLLVLVGISALAVGIDFLSKFWSSGASFSRAMELYLFKVPKAIQQFVPVAALMATLLVISTMARSNEVLALYAGGVSKIRLASTFIAAVATMSTVAFLLFDPLIPLFERRRLDLEAGKSPEAFTQLPLEGSRLGFWYRSHQMIYYVGAFYPQSNTLQGLDLYFLGPDFQVVKKIHADRARYFKGGWTLFKGTIVEYPLENPFPKSSSFSELKDIIPEKPSDFQTVEVEETTMRLRDLRKYIEKSSQYGVDTTAQSVAYHERVAHVFSPLIFVLLGLSFALNPLKNQSAAKGVGASFLLIFIYLILSKMSVSVGKGGRIPPLVAAWLPNMIFLSLASFKLVKKS